MRKNNIGVLIGIIVLMCLCIPAAIYGTYMNIISSGVQGSPNKEFYYNGKLYFYNIEKLLGTYTCETKECGYAKNSINNEEFESFNTEEKEIKLINNHYAFIKDGNKIILYDVLKETKIIEYKEVKNYSVGIDGNYYLVKNTSDLWGMIEIKDNISVKIPIKYQYLGLKEKMTVNNNISSDRVIANSENDWRIITDENNIITSNNNKIINYSDYFIVTEGNLIFDYDQNQILANEQLSDIKLIDRLAIFITTNGMYGIYDYNKKTIIDTIPITNGGAYIFKVEDDALNVYQLDRLIKTIALN